MDGCSNEEIVRGKRARITGDRFLRRTAKVVRQQAHQSVVRSVAIAIVILTTSGCTSLSRWWENGFKVGPDYYRPLAAVSDGWIDNADPRVKSTPAQDLAWWTVFSDSTLNWLIDSAYHQNLDLRTAGARILEARARRSIAVGNLFPQSQSAVGGYAHAQISQNIGLPLPNTLNIWADGFNASWELDFWGRYRRSIESADAALDASTEAYGEALVLVLSEVATNYVQLRTFEQRLKFAHENVELQRKSLEIAEARFKEGTATELDVRQASANLAQTESSIPALEAGHRLSGNRLCILLGMPASDLAAQLAPAQIPNAPLEVAVGIPADLLCRRPDIRRAEREVAAQSAQIGVAEADLYPRLGVNGFIGYAAEDLNGVFDARNLTGWIIPSFQWNILNYGRITNNVCAQDARLQALTLKYEQTVLTAGREVEDALVQFLQSQRQAMFLEQTVADAQRSVMLVTKQFEAGTTDFNRVYTTQTQLVTQQDQLAATRGNIAQYLIQVYRSIGGGWEQIAEGSGMPQVEIQATVVEGLPQSEQSTSN